MNASDDLCDWYLHRAATLRILDFYVITPIYVISCVLGQGICLIAFYHQSKQEAAFGYQAIVAVCQMMEAVAYVFYALFTWLAGMLGWAGVAWFRSSYFGMWLAAHIFLPLLEAVDTLPLFLSVATVADRVFALAKPFAYKNINHKKHQVVACVLATLISFGSSIYDCFSENVTISDDGLYTNTLNEEFVGSTVANAFSHLKNFLRAGGVVALIVLNALMIAFYRSSMKRVAKMTSDQRKRAERERVLIILAIFGSVFAACKMSTLIVFYTILYMKTDFGPCREQWMTLAAPVVDIIFETFDMCDIYLVFAVSKQFRKMILESVPWLKKITTCGKQERPNVADGLQRAWIE